MQDLNRFFFISLFLSMSFLFCSVPAEASLFSRGTDSLGNQLIYDDVLDVTWYDYSNGVSTWTDTVNWVENLSVQFGANTYNDWRLPTALPVNGSDYNYDDSTDGFTDMGLNITSTNAELAHLFYVSLGNVADPGDEHTFDTDIFENLNEWYYWYGTIYEGPPQNGDFNWNLLPDNFDWDWSKIPADSALFLTLADGTRIYDLERGFFFNFVNGSQGSSGGTTDGSMTNYSIAVLDGDVSASIAPVPEPSTWLLLSSGLLGLCWYRRKSKKV